MKFLLTQMGSYLKFCEHQFITVPPSASGFKVITVTPHSEEACVLMIDLDANNTEHSKTNVMVRVEDSLRIAKFLLTQSIVDLVQESTEKKDKEKKDDETQH